MFSLFDQHSSVDVLGRQGRLPRRLPATRAAAWLLACALALPIAATAADVQRRVYGALVMENIPEIPAEISDTLFQYQQARGASFAGWLPAPQGLLITTRFGQTRQVHRVREPLGDRQQLTFFPEPISNIAPSSDPEQSVFLFGKDSGGNESYQIYLQEVTSGKQRRLTDGKARNTAPLWSNLGDRFAYSTTARNGQDTDIHVYDMASGESRPVLEQQGLWYALDWSPDDRRLLVLRYVSRSESYPHVLDLDSGALLPFRPGPDNVSFGSGRFARDGSGIYYTSDEGTEFRQLRFHAFADGESTLLSGDIPWDVSGFALSRDGRYLAFVVNADGRSEIHVRAVRGWRRLPAPKLPMGVVSGLRFSEDGWRLGFTLNSPRSPGDVYSFRVAETQLTRWTHSEVGGLDTTGFVEPELVRYPTFDDDADGLRRTIPALVYRPPGDGPHPVLILMHGGPASQTRPTFNPVLQYWVRELGIAVIAPNVRGSTGYGKTWQQLDNGRLREDSIRDVGSLLDWIDWQEDLDARRVGIIGGSYGGYAVLASLIHYGDRLRAGVDVVGISNFVTFLENTKDYRRYLRREEYGDERDPDMRLFLESISPTNHAHRIRRPLFIAQGANDPRVPQSEADQMVQTIRANPEAGEVWYFLARDEGHGFRKKSNRDLYNNAVALFLREHLLPLPPEPEPQPTPELPPAAESPLPAPEASPLPELVAPPVTLPAVEGDPSAGEQAPLEAPTEDPPIDVLDPLPQPEDP
jgi:dipeptidyl aminopeptidase/acylaminoacyl peptidase